MPEDPPIPVRTLRTVLRQMYPITRQKGISLDVSWEKRFESYLIRAQQGNLVRHTLLHQEEAKACLEGEVCVYLGTWLLSMFKEQ